LFSSSKHILLKFTWERKKMYVCTRQRLYSNSFDTKYCGEGSDDGKERRLGRVGGNLMAMEGKFDGKSVKIGIGKVFGLVWSRFEGF
jgi:hypothetical protein